MSSAIFTPSLLPASLVNATNLRLDLRADSLLFAIVAPFIPRPNILIGANPPIICSILSLLQKAFHSSSLLAPIALSKAAPANSSLSSPIVLFTPAFAIYLLAVPPAFINAPIAPLVDSLAQLFGTIFFNILLPAPTNAPPRRSVPVSAIELNIACKSFIFEGSILYSPSLSPCVTVPDFFSQ